LIARNIHPENHLSGQDRNHCCPSKTSFWVGLVDHFKQILTILCHSCLSTYNSQILKGRHLVLIF